MNKLVILASLLFSMSGLSQSGWDLEQCIKYAEAHSLSLKISAVNAEMSKNNLNQSKAGVLPSLNAGAQHNLNFGKTVDRFSGTFANTQFVNQNYYISSNMTIWSGLSQYNNIRANEFNYMSNLENTKQQVNDLSLNVANAYLNVIFCDELLKISQNQFEVTKEQLDRTQKLVEAGALAKSVEYDIKAQLANEEVNVTTAENNHQLALLSLRQLMNYDSVSNFSIQRPAIEIEGSQSLTSDVQYIYETALKNQPGIKSGEFAIMSADKTYAASKGRISPNLSVTGTIGTGYSEVAKRISGYEERTDTLGYLGATPFTYISQAPLFEKTPFSNQIRDNVNKTIGFTLNIPLFNGLSTYTSVRNAKLNVLTARYNQDLRKQNLYKNIAQAHMNAKASLNKYNACKSSLMAAQESFKFTQQKFNAGTLSALDFTTAKNRLFAAESNLLQAKYDFVFRMKVLDFYQGKPLGF